MPRLPAFAALACLALAGCEGRDPVILKLEGERIRRSDFERHVAAVEARDLGPLSLEARRGLLETFLEQRALVIEARRQGLLSASAAADQELPAVTRLLASAVPLAQVSDAEVLAWHAAHASELRVPATVSLRQVLVGSLNEARDVKRRLVKTRDPGVFDQIARAQSKGPEAAVGGYMGSFARGQLPAELESAAFGLAEGGVSEPVESPLGYHVLRVESRQAAREIPLAEARERIRDRLARDKRAAAERAFVAAVMARAKVNHEAALRPFPPSP